LSSSPMVYLCWSDPPSRRDEDVVRAGGVERNTSSRLVHAPRAGHPQPITHVEGRLTSMQTRANERIAYFNGDYVPESQVLVPFRDRSWIFGDGAFDVARTFNGRVFRLEEHVERLYRSLKYLRIDPGLSPAEMIEISREVIGRNVHLLGADEDYWVAQRISRGVQKGDGDLWDHYGPNVIVECSPLPLKARARLFRDGIDVIIPSVRRTPPESLTPRATSRCTRATRRPGRCSSTSTATSARGWARMSSWSGTGGCSPRASASSCRA
jgi:hypothetical protein